MSEPLCDNCLAPATHERPNSDCVYGEFGAEYRWYTENLCDDCDPAKGWEDYLLPQIAGVRRMDYR